MTRRRVQRWVGVAGHGCTTGGGGFSPAAVARSRSGNAGDL